MNVQIERLTEDAVLPTRATEGSAGYDLAIPGGTVVSLPGSLDGWKPSSPSVLIKLGFAIAIPEGYVGLVCPRSGLAARYSISVANAPGVIDSDYRGEVGVILISHNTRSLIIKGGDRIGQLVIVPTPEFTLIEVDRLSSTVRGAGGFGSTGFMSE